VAEKKVRKRVNRLPAEQRIADIMVAARAVFTTKGYESALISDIAERAGVVDGSIYRFFVNKRELLMRVVEDWYEKIILDDDERYYAVRGTWNRIRFIVFHHLQAIVREPALTKLAFTELRADPEYRQMRLYKLNQAYTRRLVELVREAIDAGEFRSDVSPSLVRSMLYGCVEHSTWAFLRHEGKLDVELVADGIADILYNGLVARQADDILVLADRLEAATVRLERLSGANDA
jgi:TetR/AcrR family fatty acid metabolism transcriptional regulator